MHYRVYLRFSNLPVSNFSPTPSPSPRNGEGSLNFRQFKNGKNGNLKIKRTRKYESGKMVKCLPGYIL
ncbi:hypothetical protein DC498_03980 [Terrimonas sp.]|nr:hypothetical protein DC498_03980 [Terrimonas sp.]